MRQALAFCTLMLAAVPAFASGLNGAELPVTWALPFLGILLCIALCPLLVPHFWHLHFGKVAVFWACLCIVPLFMLKGPDVAVHSLAHAMLGDYIPFIIFVGTLFIVAGGIHIKSSFVGTPLVNAAILLLGAFFANIMGTTGAAMLLIRPLLQANKDRKHVTHTFIFFIFLVANVGGCLTPLGDPPLFLGFLRGVDFFWTASHLFIPMVTVTAIILAIYLAFDYHFWRKEDHSKMVVAKEPFRIEGKVNILLLFGVVGAVLMSGLWDSGVTYTILGVHFTMQSILRDICFVLISEASLLLTAKAVRHANRFTWDPILEVAKLFFGIFACIVPVLEMLRAGHAGVFAPLVSLVSNADGSLNNDMFFWLAGSLSAFLDNAPTYLAFFNLAGGDPVHLMGEGYKTLMAISMGSVFMGAMSYIGNAPNFMTVAIVKERGIPMPSFFGYMVWSVGILAPSFFIVTMIFL